MTPRDRNVLMGVLCVVMVGAAWFLLLSPVRKDASALDASLVAAQGRAQTAEAAATSGQQAQEAYQRQYATVARLGKAVPADDDVPSLVVQLQGAAKRSRVDFRSIELAASVAAPVAAPPAAQAVAVASGTTGATGAAGAVPAVPAVQAVAATLPPGAAVGAAGFPTMPFDFAFTGSFFRLADFLHRLDRFTRIAGENVSVTGRLLSVDGFALGASPKGFPSMTASIHATAYLLPAEEGLTAGASPLQPAALPAGTTTPAVAGGTPAVPTAAATAKGVGTP